jgi:hypothetical protein
MLGPSVPRPSDHTLVPDALARAAAHYQRHAIRLETLRRRRLGESADRSPAIGDVPSRSVLELIAAARLARKEFRERLATHVDYLKQGGASLDRVLEQVGEALHVLCEAGVLAVDGGALAYESAHWTMEAYAARPARVIPFRSGASAPAKQSLG